MCANQQIYVAIHLGHVGLPPQHALSKPPPSFFGPTAAGTSLGVGSGAAVLAAPLAAIVPLVMSEGVSSTFSSPRVSIEARSLPTDLCWAEGAYLHIIVRAHATIHQRRVIAKMAGLGGGETNSHGKGRVRSCFLRGARTHQHRCR